MTLADYLYNFLLTSGFFRFLGIALVFPSAEGLIGIGTRLGLAIALAGLGFNEFHITALPLSAWHIMGELVLGVLLGAPLLVLYHGLRMWGDLFESLRGHQMGLIIDPLSGGEEQALSILLSHTFLYVLLAQALFPLMTQIAFSSLEKIPPATIFVSLLTLESQHLFMSLRAILSLLFTSLLPFACLVVMIELAMAVVSKLCSGWSLSQEGYLVRMVALMCLLYFQAPSLFNSCLVILRPLQAF
jgi:flagellar biosynthesis protein FliR